MWKSRTVIIGDFSRNLKLMIFRSSSFLMCTLVVALRLLCTEAIATGAASVAPQLERAASLRCSRPVVSNATVRQGRMGIWI